MEGLWHDRPYTRGAFSGNLAPGALTECRGAARDSGVRGVHFATTELAMVCACVCVRGGCNAGAAHCRAQAWVGYFEGALESGGRVAARVAEELRGLRALPRSAL